MPVPPTMSPVRTGCGSWRHGSKLCAAPSPPHPAPSRACETWSSPRKGCVTYGSVRVDFDSRTVTVGGHLVHLPRREFDLLALLLSPPGHLWTRAQLIEQLWPERHCAGSRTLDTHIRRLRQKLERGTGRARHLVTIRGLGFRYDVVPTETSSEDATFGDRFSSGTSQSA